MKLIPKAVSDATRGFRNRVLEARPAVAFGFFATLTLLASLWCFKAFDTWPDRYTAAGYYVSLFGFGYVLFELFRGKHIAEVARQSYLRAANLMRSTHYEFCLDEAQASLESALAELTRKQWTAAATSLHHLRRHCSYIQSIRVHADERWHQFADSAAYWAMQFAKGPNGKAYAYDEQAWSDASNACGHAITAEVVAFTPLKEDADATDD